MIPENSDETRIYAIARATDEQLAQCDVEPIHIPEAIQPHGFLLQVDVEDLRIQRASANTAAYIGLAADKLLGQKLSSVLPNPHQILATLGALTQQESVSNCARGATNRMHINSELPIPAFECATHVLLDGSFVLEFEPTLISSSTHRIDQERYQSLRTIYDTQEAGDSLAEVFQLTAAGIRRFTQYDRAMISQMNAEGHGSIVAESKLDSLESYRG